LWHAAAQRSASGFQDTTAWNKPLAGEVLLRTDHQLAVSVDEYGPGLVVLHTMTASHRSPAGGGMLILTTYEFGDAEAAALRRAG
jgi:hypothetical protein